MLVSVRIWFKPGPDLGFKSDTASLYEMLLGIKGWLSLYTHHKITIALLQNNYSLY